MKKKVYKKKEDVRSPQMPSFPPSEEQKAFFDRLPSRKSVLLSASPGAGKSTTLTMAMQIVGAENAAMISFGKDIADEIRPKCPAWVDVGTCYSFGYRALAAKHGRLFPRLNLTRDTILEMYPRLNPFEAKDEDKPYLFQALRDSIDLIDRLRITKRAAKDAEELAASMNLYPHDQVIWSLGPILQKIRAEPSKPDFIGMLELPLMMGYPMKQFDTIYTDECQDFSPLVMEFVKASSKGRIIAAGDRDQAIYTWAGASPTAVSDMVESFDCEELPLNVCYRCGTDIVSKAATVVDKILPFSGNKPGVVEYATSIDKNMPDGSFIIARRNASLIKPAIDLITSGRKAIIKGRDIGDSMLKSLGTSNDADAVLKKFEKPKRGREDEAACITTLLRTLPSVEAARSFIKQLFSDSSTGITLSSVHRAKGKEAGHVTIMDYGKIRAGGISELERFEEQCIEFVALTRAKDKLTLIP
jgi:DNA helicase II / ATP-dependent DNA helicase PcrA